MGRQILLKQWVTQLVPDAGDTSAELRKLVNTVDTNGDGFLTQDAMLVAVRGDAGAEAIAVFGRAAGRGGGLRNKGRRVIGETTSYYSSTIAGKGTMEEDYGIKDEGSWVLLEASN